jgi:hypothetical protein
MRSRQIPTKVLDLSDVDASIREGSDVFIQAGSGSDGGL